MRTRGQDPVEGSLVAGSSLKHEAEELTWPSRLVAED